VRQLRLGGNQDLAGTLRMFRATLESGTSETVLDLELSGQRIEREIVLWCLVVLFRQETSWGFSTETPRRRGDLAYPQLLCGPLRSSQRRLKRKDHTKKKRAAEKFSVLALIAAGQSDHGVGVPLLKFKKVPPLHSIE
jgi:hypothetical protein